MSIKDTTLNDNESKKNVTLKGKQSIKARPTCKLMVKVKEPLVEGKGSEYLSLKSVMLNTVIVCFVLWSLSSRMPMFLLIWDLCM